MKYILKDGKAIPCEDFERWAQFMEMGNRQIASTFVEGTHISTVFLGIDHDMMDTGPPLLFETMTFSDISWADDHQWCYATLEQAKKGHEKIVEAIMEKQNLKELEL